MRICSQKLIWIEGCIFLAALPALAQQVAEYNNMGIDAYNNGQYKDAIYYFEKAYDQTPDHPTVRRNLCNAHQAAASELAKAGDLRGACRQIELVLGIDPENASPLVQLGSYYLRRDDVRQAIFRLEEAIELKPGNLEAHEMLGEAYYLDNDIPAARVQWDYVLEMDPTRKNLKERYEKAFREESVEYDFNRAGSRHFKISYPKGVPYQLRAFVLTTLERAYMDVGRKFGGVYPPGPIQVIVYDAQQFREATQLNGHVGAVYDGKIRSPLTDASGQWLEEGELGRRLTHEYVHVVVRHVAGANVPWWLNEGLAETFSRDLDAPRRHLLQQVYEEGKAFSLRDLEAHQLKVLTPDTLRVAYAQSHAAVNHLWTRFGQRRMIGMMQDLAGGETPEAALRKQYKRTYLSLEEEVAKTIL